MHLRPSKNFRGGIEYQKAMRIQLDKISRGRRCTAICYQPLNSIQQALPPLLCVRFLVGNYILVEHCTALVLSTHQGSKCSKDRWIQLTLTILLHSSSQVQLSMEPCLPCRRRNSDRLGTARQPQR
jgi:hypothetical protein